MTMTYANDTCLLFSSKSWEKVYLKARKGLNLMHKCISEMSLRMNSDKTTYMELSINKLINEHFPLIIHNYKNQLICNMQVCKQVTQISKICYFGIIFIIIRGGNTILNI